MIMDIFWQMKPQKTNLDGVFAIGDIRSKPLRQIVTAASDGATASKFVEEYLMRLK